jgi:hypothetical protein
MPSYTKLWGQILESTIWQEPNDLIVLWIAILALKDKDHLVLGTIPGLAARAKIDNETCAKYIAQLESPDKWSGNQEHEGRRLAKVEGGWLVLNGQKYQDFMREEQRREACKSAMQRLRAKRKARPKS